VEDERDGEVVDGEVEKLASVVNWDFGKSQHDELLAPVGGEHGEPAEEQHDGTALAEHQNHENEGDYVRVSQQVEIIARQHVVHVFL
jgi:hypothetical protein